MNDWTAGYVADIGYTFGYYPELNPVRLGLAFANAGLVCPEVGTACELGFGQGLSVNLHAAATTGEWHGTDFNPTHAAFATDMAAAAGNHAALYDQSFEEFCTRSDLPDFDYIGLHGIWSWISDANRAVIVDFVRRKLKLGGVLYVSYNALPGWAAFAPMRHLLAEHARLLGGEGRGAVARVEGAIEFAERLIAAEPVFATANPAVKQRMTHLKTQNRQYLAHEYFNRDWRPMHFADVAESFKSAKLEFACSANFIDHLDSLTMTRAQRELLASVADPILCQTVRDFIVNQQFRKDYWVKGPRRLAAHEQLERFRGQRVILATPRADVPAKISGARGEATVHSRVCGPVLDLMADHVVRSVGEIEAALKGHRLGLNQLVQAVLLLAAHGHVAPVQSEASVLAALPATQRINAWLMARARYLGEVNYLASPLTGGAVGVGRFQQLFISMVQQGLQTPEDCAGAVWDLLAEQGQRLVHEGKTLSSPEDNLAQLTEQAQAFMESQLPALRALRVA